MQIVKNRKRINANEIFIEKNDFILFLKNLNDKINFENELILSKINLIYLNMINNDGVISFNKIYKWLPSQFGFKKSSILTIDFWLERGWDENYAKTQISDITKDITRNAVITKNMNKKNISFNNKDEIKIFFKNTEFYSKEHPNCNVCGSKLKLQKINVNNTADNFYYKIIGCENKNCKSVSYKQNKQYLSYLPENIANDKIKKNYDTIKKRNIFCVESWQLKGFSLEEAKKNISELQVKNSSKVKNRFIPSKENLKKNGFTDDEIIKKTLTPSKIEFWLAKNFSLEEAKDLVSKNQSFASKHVDYSNRLLPNNINYWFNLGYSYLHARKKVKERQKTFSLDICIKKYGEIDGLIRFNERQIKWLKNYKKSNFSKISQDLFWEILKANPSIIDNEIYFATYLNGNLDDSGKNNEFRLELTERVILPDFIDLTNKKIIEFDGTYYHRISPENNLRELKRDEMIIKSGYEVLHISEKDYYSNKEDIIYKCVNFLNKN